MKWINILSELKIPYYIYKLNKGDKIIYNLDIHYNQSIVIINGIICIFKIINNKKINFLAVLTNDHLINIGYYTNNINGYYKFIAFETTYIISFSLKNIKKKYSYNYNILINIINAQKLTLKQYEITNNLLRQKYIKYKVIQLILFFGLEFGIIYKKQITIPFSISQNYLAMIIGTNKNNINKIIQTLLTNKIIKYSSKKIIQINNIQNLASFILY